MSWKPIDVAPRDGSVLVVAFRSPLSGHVSVYAARWTAEGWTHETPAGGEAPANGDVAFAWISLPDSGD